MVLHKHVDSDYVHGLDYLVLLRLDRRTGEPASPLRGPCLHEALRVQHPAWVEKIVATHD